MHENELLDLIPGMSCDFLCHITHLLEAHFVVNFHSGVFTFAHQDVSFNIFFYLIAFTLFVFCEMVMVLVF